jgi:hypothetical protein
VIFFGAGELLARGFGIVDGLNGYTRQLFTAGPSAELPYRLRPGVEIRLGAVRVRVNSLGLRGPEIAREPAPGVRRILVLGDSIVFGQGVAEDATLSAGLAHRLGGPVETVNAGAQGYDTVAEAAFLAGPGLALAPAGVVVGMSLNDYDPAPVYDPTGVLTRRPSGTPARGLLAHSEFLLLLRWLRTWSRGDLFTQILERSSQDNAQEVPPAASASLDRLVANEHLRFYRDPDPALWSRLRGGLTRLRDTAAAHGLWLLVAVFPESYQIGVAPPDLTPQRRLAVLCQELGVRCLDLAPAFAAAGGELFQDAQHPNARGLAVAADAIATAIPR